MPLITDERADDLAIFYQKIYNQFRRKGLSVTETLDILTIMVCYVAKKSDCPKEVVCQAIECHWDAWDDMDDE